MLAHRIAETSADATAPSADEISGDMAHTSESGGILHHKQLDGNIQRGESAHQKLRDQALTCLRQTPGDVRRAVASYLGWTNTSSDLWRNVRE